MQIFKIAYSDYFDPTKADEWNQICQEFVTAVQQCQPDMLNKQKVHLMLHLVECMKEFGPTSSFNSERYVLLLLYNKYIYIYICKYMDVCILCRFETFNSFIRIHNIYGNKGAPSYDITCRFATLEHLRHIGEGGYFMNGERYVVVVKQAGLASNCHECYSCGDLKKLFSSSTVQHFINCIPVRASSSNKAIYQVGALRKASYCNYYAM